MAEWKSANMRALLPAPVTTIITTIDTVLSIVSAPLNMVVGILELAKKFVVAFSLLSLAAALRKMIESFKETILASGFFICDMNDYCVKQLNMKDDYGPTSTYETANLVGNEFTTSFLKDLDASFDDIKDPSRPQFTGSCAAIVLVRASITPEFLGISAEEDNSGDTWAGLGNQIGSAGKTVRAIRTRVMLGTMREVAQVQPVAKAGIRVERVEKVLRYINTFSDDEMDAVPYHQDEESGDSYLDNKPIDAISWDNDVAPILSAIEAIAVPSAYPDWKKITLRDINPGLVDIIDYVFDPIIEMLEDGSNASSQLVDLIEAIKAKLVMLQNLIDYIDNAIDELNRLLDATGYHALWVSSSTGITNLRSQIKNATSVPFEGKFFYSGFVILAGSDTKVFLDTLFSAVAS